MPGLRILLIDDEEELVSTLQERLRMRNMEAEIATDGHSALERMRNEAFDVVVVDMKMPGLDGLDVRDTIHRLYPQVKVLLVTGHGAEGSDPRGSNAAASDVLLKPFSIDSLIAKIIQEPDE
jgi:DNA-binding response OmpR family regulator